MRTQRADLAGIGFTILFVTFVFAMGEAAAWTVSKVAVCHNASSYQYGRQVTVVAGTTAQNTYMSVTGEWRPSPQVTTVKVKTLGKGAVTVHRLCQGDPWASAATCTGDKVVSQTNGGWGLGQILKSAPDVLAPNGLLPALPAKIPVPSIASQKWGGGGLPVAIQVSGTGPRCSRRFDEVRTPPGSPVAIYPFGPTGVPPGGNAFTITGKEKPFERPGTYAVRSRIALWTGSKWLDGAWSQWFEFPFVVRAQFKSPPGSYRPKP